MADPVVPRAIPDDVRTVPMVGLPLAMTATTGVFLAISLISNSIRSYVNLSRKSLGVDDGLVLFSQLAFTASLGTTTQAASKGIGTVNSGLNSFLLMESQKWYFMWIITYLLAMVTLKTAVCMTLLRILPRTQHKMRSAVWVLLAICWVAWAIDFMAVLLLCRPIEASWNSALVAEGKAECGSQVVLIVISHILTAASIVTDIGCTILPGIMLWKMQMHKTSKLEVFALLSIASVASIATVIRAPYFARYASPEDNLSYWCGFMLLFSNIEMGIGLFASSLPAVRRFYRSTIKKENSLSEDSKSNSHQLSTFGGSGRYSKGSSARRGHSDTVIRANGSKGQGYHPGDWERLADEGSDKGILVNAESPNTDFKEHGEGNIRVNQTFEVVYSNNPSNTTTR